MATKNDGPLQQVIGRLGADPETFDSKAGQGVRVRIARPMGYGDDAETRWVEAATWNEGLIKQVKERMKKGTPVIAEGWITVTQYKGKDQYRMMASRIGLAEFFVKSPRTDGRYVSGADTQSSENQVSSDPEKDELEW